MNRDQLVPQAHAAAKHNNFASAKAASLVQEDKSTRPWGLTGTGQHHHRADKEAHERAMLAASTLTCTSLSKSVTTAWCVSVCENGLHFCPPNVCQCEKKAGFGGETTWPAARTPGHQLPRAASSLSLLETGLGLGRTHASKHASSSETESFSARLSAKMTNDAKATARAEAEVAERAAEKANSDSAMEAEAEATMELRAREKSLDDKSANRLAIALSNERANSKSVADTTSEHSNHAHAAPPSHRAAAESSIDSKIAQLEADRAASAANTEAASTMPASLPTANDKADFEIRKILQKIYEKHHDGKGTARKASPYRTALAGAAEDVQQQQQQAEDASASGASCVSRVPTATDYWCQTTCVTNKGKFGAGSCPAAVCECTGLDEDMDMQQQQQQQQQQASIAPVPKAAQMYSREAPVDQAALEAQEDAAAAAEDSAANSMQQEYDEADAEDEAGSFAERLSAKKKSALAKKLMATHQAKFPAEQPEQEHG